MAQLTEEEIKNMSPEQIAEMQKQNCIFCQITSGKIPAKKVYEDELCIAILDINPANLGHMLLLPKRHAMIMPQLTEEEMGHLGIVSKKLANSCLGALHAQGANIMIANGAIAGQRAPHFMIHIIPRKEGDKIGCFQIPEKKASESDIKQIYDAVKPRVDELFGIKTERKEQKEAQDEGKTALEKAAEKAKPIPKENSRDDRKNPAEFDAEILEETEKPKSKASKELSQSDLDKIASMFLKDK